MRHSTFVWLEMACKILEQSTKTETSVNNSLVFLSDIMLGHWLYFIYSVTKLSKYINLSKMWVQVPSHLILVQFGVGLGTRKHRQGAGDSDTGGFWPDRLLRLRFRFPSTHLSDHCHQWLVLIFQICSLFVFVFRKWMPAILPGLF